VNDMTTEYEIRLYKNLNINPAIRAQAGEKGFQKFINQVLPLHVAALRSRIQETPELLELEAGIMPYVSTYHSLTTPTGDIDVALHTEMLDRNGTITYWRTTVMTARELEEWEQGTEELLQ